MIDTERSFNSIDKGLDNFQPLAFRIFLIIAMIPFIFFIDVMEERRKWKAILGSVE